MLKIIICIKEKAKKEKEDAESKKQGIIDELHDRKELFPFHKSTNEHK